MTKSRESGLQESASKRALLTLFLEALATDRSPDAVPADPCLSAPIEWHGLEGVALAAIENGKIMLPDLEVRRLEESWRGRLRRSAVLDLEAGRIGQAVVEAQRFTCLATPILLKGESVASRYKDPLLRTYSDIDLLVPKQEAPAWGSLLRQLDYRPDNRWHERHHRSYDNHISYRRKVSGQEIHCEVHSRLCTQRSLLGFGYDPLRSAAEKTPATGLLRLCPPAQLIVLAVHLLHHFRADRRLIWYRDFVELGHPQVIEEARRLAEAWGVRWVMEWALAEVQRTAHQNLWDARPRTFGTRGMLKVLENDKSGIHLHAAIASELPVAQRVRFVVSKLDPRRFVGSSGHFEWILFVNWIHRMAVLAGLRDKSQRTSSATKDMGSSKDRDTRLDWGRGP